MAHTSTSCHECGLIQTLRVLDEGEKALCSRCGCVLSRHRPPTFERALALAVASLILFLVANIMPFLTIEIGGIRQETNLISGVEALFNQGKYGVSFLVLFTTILAPGLLLLTILAVLLPLSMNRTPPELALTFRFAQFLRSWTLMDVFMIGIFVSFVKVASLSTLVPGVALFSFMLLIFLLAGTQASIDTDLIWQRSKRQGELKSSKAAKASEEVKCLSCHLDIAEPARFINDNRVHVRCPRCFSKVSPRKENSIQRSWALLIAAIIFYIPANLLPVMYVTNLGHSEGDTIMSGVMYFLSSGEWYLALIIFGASIFIPFMKIGLLMYLLVSVQRQSLQKMQLRTRFYRFIEMVGRWSMVDVFVVSILAALVQFGNLSTIEAGWGAAFFAAVVILTIFAANAFDPRLIWDAAQRGRHSSER